MRRRQFITLLGGAAAWPLAARAEPAMPMVGLLDPTSPDAYAHRLRGFRKGLNDTGYVEGENVLIQYNWAENQTHRLPALAADLVRRSVAVIATSGGSAPALAARTATTTIPIVFSVGEDPVKLGLVASLARPDGNATGVNFFIQEVVAKRLDILRELVPRTVRMAVLVNPAHAANTDSTLKEVEAASTAIGLQIQVLNASTDHEIDAAFATIVRERPDVLFVGPDPFLFSRRVQLVQLAARYAVPATYASRENVEAGGLISYGADLKDASHQAGVYVGKILKGAKPADLPVVQATKFELVINLKTAKALGLEIPSMLLARADEVIE